MRDALLALIPDNRFYAAKFAGIDLATAAFTDLPFTTKAELLADQAAHPPYGSALSFPLDRYCRLHQTSGTTTGKPLRWLDTAAGWDWLLDCWRTNFEQIGLRRDDRLFIAFSFGPFLGFWTAFEAASRDGYFVLPGGGMSSTARLRMLFDHQATVLFCTPTYAMHLAEVAEQDGVNLAEGPVRMIVVAGEPGGSIPSTRRRLEAVWGARVIDHSGMTEIGPCAIEPLTRPGGLELLPGFHAEVIDPATLQSTEDEVGELVLTNLGRVGSPLVRYRTGDLVRSTPGVLGLRLDGGVLGRIDDMIHVRGNNVYPSAIEAVIRRFHEVVEFRIIVDRRESLVDLEVEIECVPSANVSMVVEQVSRTLRDELLFRADVSAVPAGQLPRFDMKARRIIHRPGAEPGSPR